MYFDGWIRSQTGHESIRCLLSLISVYDRHLHTDFRLQKGASGVPVLNGLPNPSLRHRDDLSASPLRAGLELQIFED